MFQQLNNTTAANQTKKFPKAAEIEAQIDTRSYRRGVGNLFLNTQPNGKVKKLSAMPGQPTFLDFFKLRMEQTSNHVLQSANRAMKTGMTEEIILACLLHDTVHALIKTDHGYWGAQLYAPYVPEKVSFAIRSHQAIRPVSTGVRGNSRHRFPKRSVSKSDTIRHFVSTTIRKQAMSIRICIAICSAKITRRCRTYRPITKCSRATNGTWNRDWSPSMTCTPSSPALS